MMAKRLTTYSEKVLKWVAPISLYSYHHLDKNSQIFIALRNIQMAQSQRNSSHRMQTAQTKLLDLIREK